MVPVVTDVPNLQIGTIAKLITVGIIGNFAADSLRLYEEHDRSLAGGEE
jgi:hypothetical protein